MLAVQEPSFLDHAAGQNGLLWDGSCASETKEAAGGLLGAESCSTETMEAALPPRTEHFEMFCLKVVPCTKRYTHDWTSCPYAHQGERAARRDPRTHNYTGICCTSMKTEGSCALGDSCPYAHSAFEYWLHPSRYHTEICKQGVSCNRKICFFAHRPEELRKPLIRPGVSTTQTLAMATLDALAAAGMTPAPPPPPKCVRRSSPVPASSASLPAASLDASTLLAARLGAAGSETGLGAGLAGLPAGLAAVQQVLPGCSGAGLFAGTNAGTGALGASHSVRLQSPSPTAALSRLSSTDTDPILSDFPFPSLPPSSSSPLDALLPAGLLGPAAGLEAAAAPAGASMPLTMAGLSLGRAGLTTNGPMMGLAADSSPLAYASPALPSAPSQDSSKTLQAVMCLLREGQISPDQAAKILSATLPPAELLQLQRLLGLSW